MLEATARRPSFLFFQKDSLSSIETIDFFSTQLHSIPRRIRIARSFL